MKDILIPIDQAGRIVLPKHVRQELAIQPGDLLKLSMQGTQLTLALSSSKAGFQRSGKALIFTASGEERFGPEVVNTLLNELNDERFLPASNEKPPKKRKE